MNVNVALSFTLPVPVPVDTTHAVPRARRGPTFLILVWCAQTGPKALGWPSITVPPLLSCVVSCWSYVIPRSTWQTESY